MAQKPERDRAKGAAGRKPAAGNGGSGAPQPAANGKARQKSNDFENVIRSLMDNAGTVIAGKTVVGEPVVVGDTTLIPLNDVTIGAAAGSNSGGDKNAGLGGFTARMSPNSVLIIRDGVTKVVNIRTQDSVTKIVDMIPDVVDRILEQPAIRRMMGDEEAVKRAFPEEAGQQAEDTVQEAAPDQTAGEQDS